MEHNLLVHEAEDHVGVAILGVEAGSQAQAVTLDGRRVRTVEVTQDIPLGHKVALRDIAEGSQVVEYGRSIGRATQAIPKGSHVHVHNLKSERW